LSRRLFSTHHEPQWSLATTPASGQAVNDPIADIHARPHHSRMPAWLALPLTALSAAITVLSFRANKEATRTGRLRFLFWHIPGWGERERSPTFFKFAQAQNHYRTFFFGLLTVVLAAYFLEAVGAIY
jgi:hypothetical protein